MKKILVCLWLLLVIIGLTSCDEKIVFTEKTKTSQVAIRGVYDIDGNAYLPTMDGNCISLKGDVEQAFISPDRKTISYIDNGKLIYQVVGTDEKEVIQTDVESIIAVRNNGIVYRDKNDRIYRYLPVGEPLLLGEGSVLVANDNMNLAVANNNAVYYLEANSQDKTKIGTFDIDVELLYVTNQGIVVWADQSSTSEKIMLYENGESERIGVYDLHLGYFSSYYSTTQVIFDSSEKYMVVKNYYSNIIYQKKNGEEAQKVSFADNVNSIYPSTAKGALTMTDYVDSDGIFVLVGSNKDSLYWVNKEGESEKVLSNVNDLAICGGYIFYVDDDTNLFYGKIEGSLIKNEEKVTSDVSELGIVSGNNGSVSFFKNFGYTETSGYTGTLYIYKAGDESPTKVSNDCYYFVYPNGDDTILFCSDVQRLNALVGTLYSYSLGEDSPQKIATDVIPNAIEGGLRYLYIDKEAFLYKKYSSTIDSTIYYNLYFYNGNESVLLAKEVTDYYPKE